MKHRLSLNATAEQDRMWISCSCGWIGESHTVPSDDMMGKIMFTARREGQEHIAATQTITPASPS